MKFGLIYHLFYPEEALDGYGVDLAQGDKVIPCGLCVAERKQIEDMVAQKDIVTCDSTMRFASKLGRECSGKEWTIPLTPEMILHNQSAAVEMTARACQQAQEWGSDIAGLGLMLGRIGRRGQDVKEHVDIPVTNGDSYLIFHSAQVVKNLLAFFGWAPEAVKVAVYGFPSTIGTTLTEYLLSQGIEVVLIARQTSHVQKLIKKISDKYYTPIKLVTTFSEALQETRIILTAGSGAQVLNPDEMDDPVIVIDVSFPRNVFQPSEKMLVIDANAIPMPRDIVFSEGYVPERIPTCLAELILLSFEDKKEGFSLGRNLSLENIAEIGALAQKHGFVADLLYSFDKPVEMQRLEDFKSLLSLKEL